MRENCKYQWEYRIQVVTELPIKKNKIKERLRNNLELYFGIAGSGYGRIFPRETYSSVGINRVTKYFPYPTKSIFDFLRKDGFFGKYEIHGHRTLGGGIKRRATGSKCLIVRETAGFVDTFSGERLTDAIIPRQFASEVIAGICLCFGNLKNLGIYKSLCNI
jgi:flavin-dependent dehydrogenase